MITTRLRYHIRNARLLAGTDLVAFSLSIGETGTVALAVSATEFHAFTLDLGLSPVDPEGTEYTPSEPPLYHGNRWP